MPNKSKVHVGDPTAVTDVGPTATLLVGARE